MPAMLSSNNVTSSDNRSVGPQTLTEDNVSTKNSLQALFCYLVVGTLGCDHI